MIKLDTQVEIADLAWEDIRAAGTGNEVGVILIVLGRTDDDELATQLVASVPSDVLDHALHVLVGRRQGRTRRLIRRPARKASQP